LSLRTPPPPWPSLLPLHAALPICGTPVGEPRHHVAAEGRHGGRQLARTGGRLAEPERNGGRRAGSVLDTHASGLDAANAPRAVRSEEHTSELQSRGHLVCRLLLEK